MTMKKTEILIVGPTPPPYIGPGVATDMILKSALKERFKLLHLDTSDHRDISNIGVLDSRNIYLTFKQFLNLLLLLLKYSPRIVYIPICQTIIGYLRDTLFMIFSKLFGARVVLHLRGGYLRELYKRSNLFVKFVIKYSCKFTSKIIVLGESLRNIFEGLVPAERIAVVPNGIDKNYITDQKFRVDLGHNPGKSALRILFLSNLTFSKGYFDVIKSIPEVLQQGKDVEFIFAGHFWDTEKTRQEVIRYLDEHKLNSFVIFAGRVIGKAKKDLLLSSDIFVLPTYYLFEGQPWVIVEAMAAGLPIISTDQGSIREMVVDGENGFIIEKKNPKQIAEKIICLFKSEKLRKQMGQESRERFLKYFTKDVFINSLSNVFVSVLEEAT